MRSAAPLLVRGCAGALVLVTAVVYTAVNVLRLHRYESLDWDLSIFAQGVWLLSRGQQPFVTIRGLHLFGDHASYVHLLIAPLYRLHADVRWLLLLQAAALAASGALLFRIAERRLRGVTPLLVLLAWVLHPGLQYTWLEYYELESLALPFLLASWDAAESGRSRAALAWAALALVTKENVSAIVFAMGLWTAVRGRRRLGAALAATAALYMVFLRWVAFPAFNSDGYVYLQRWFSYRGGVSHALLTAQNRDYLLAIFLPVAFLPLLAPAPLLVGVQLPLNLLSAWPYAHEIRYHYVVLALPFVFLALIAALARLRPGGPRVAACVALLAGVLIGQWKWAPPLLSPREGAAQWRAFLSRRPDHTAVDRLIAQIPPEASVSTQYQFLPHVCHRPRVYMFPDGLDSEAVLFDADRIVGDRKAEAAAEALVAHGYVYGGTSGRAVLLLRPPGGR